MDTDAASPLHRWTRMKEELGPDLNMVTEAVIGTAFAVSRTLGHGFLEAVYRNALAVELAAAGLHFFKEKVFPVYYREEKVGHYIADLVVENLLIVELKAVEAISTLHVAQTLNYLKASNLSAGLVLNFGKPRLEVKRVLL
jgi:GxxExxY protein